MKSGNKIAATPLLRPTAKLAGVGHLFATTIPLPFSQGLIRLWRRREGMKGRVINVTLTPPLPSRER